MLQLNSSLVLVTAGATMRKRLHAALRSAGSYHAVRVMMTNVNITLASAANGMETYQGFLGWYVVIVE